MPPDHQYSRHSGYGQPNWMNVPSAYSASPQTSMSPIKEYSACDYHPVTPTPIEPAYNMSRASPFVTTHAQMPLIIPYNGVWPSMLASQPQANYQPPILPAEPIQTTLSASTGSNVTPTSVKLPPRRKLTDDDRRQMCIEAEQNPFMKQVQIGAKFNVERSTVSKILRQRDKYINPKPKEDSSSPEKKSKAKLPDFEKTLANWVRNQQKKGLPISDEDLQKQAQVFSFRRDDRAVVVSADWLEKFKYKHRLLADRTDNDLNLINSSTTLNDQTSVGASPTSSNGGLVSPPMSAINNLATNASIKLKGADFFNYKEKDNFRDSPMENNLMGGIEQGTSDTIMSPLSPGDSKVENDMSGLGPEDMIRDLVETSQRQRSQTFSHISQGYGDSRPSSAGHRAPSLPVRSLTSTDIKARPTAIDPRQIMKRHKSVPDIHYPEQSPVSSMQPPLLPRSSADVSPVSYPASSVDDEQLIRALHKIKSLLEQNPSVAEPDDYLLIGKLMSKLKQLRPVHVASLPGGMHPVDTMNNPRISKKRTILGIST